MAKVYDEADHFRLSDNSFMLEADYTTEFGQVFDAGSLVERSDTNVLIYKDAFSDRMFTDDGTAKLIQVHNLGEYKKARKPIIRKISNCQVGSRLSHLE